MAHVAKHTKAAAGHLCKHYERAKDEQGEYLRFGNQDIDPCKSVQNYNLAPEHDGGQMEFLQNRCDKVKCLNRKDVNVMCSWIVTAPQSIVGNSETEKKFFDETYKFLADRYGKENIISAYVHMDEITPHMHFAFVPVIADKKTQKLKVSAKEVVDRRDLQSFHTDLDRHLAQELGNLYRGGILNGATKDGNRSIEELKRQSAADQLADVKREAANIQEEAAKKAREASQQEKRMKVNLKQGHEELKSIQGQTAAYKATLATFNDIDRIGKKALLGSNVTMSADEANQLKEQAKAYWAAKSDAKKFRDDADRQWRYSSHLEKLDKETVPELRQQICSLTAEKNEAVRKLNKALSVIDSDAELSKSFDRQLRIFNQQEEADRQQRDRHMGYDYDMER